MIPRNVQVLNEQPYQFEFLSDRSPKEVFDLIANVDKWWSKSFEGSASRAGDQFAVRFWDHLRGL